MGSRGRGHASPEGWHLVLMFDEDGTFSRSDFIFDPEDHRTAVQQEMREESRIVIANERPTNPWLRRVECRGELGDALGPGLVERADKRVWACEMPTGGNIPRRFTIRANGATPVEAVAAR